MYLQCLQNLSNVFKTLEGGGGGQGQAHAGYQFIKIISKSFFNILIAIISC